MDRSGTSPKVHTESACSAAWTRQQQGNEEQVRRTVAMGRMLWSNPYRHSTGDESKPAKVPLAEAEAAVHLAIPLVQWFTQGIIKPSASQ